MTQPQYNSLYEIRLKIEECFTIHGLLYKDFAIKLSFAGGLTRAYGVAKRTFNSQLGRPTFDVSFSGKLWPGTSPEMRQNTVVHEACHVIDWIKNGCTDHGYRFRQLMRDCGENPNISKTLDHESVALTSEVHCILKCSKGLEDHKCKAIYGMSRTKIKNALLKKASLICPVHGIKLHVPQDTVDKVKNMIAGQNGSV